MNFVLISILDRIDGFKKEIEMTAKPLLPTHRKVATTEKILIRCVPQSEDVRQSVDRRHWRARANALCQPLGAIRTFPMRLTQTFVMLFGSSPKKDPRPGETPQRHAGLVISPQTMDLKSGLRR